MKTNNETEELNQLIIEVKAQNNYELAQLKTQFQVAYESLKPVNIVKKIFHDITTAPDIKDNMISNSIGISTGILSKKLVMGNSHNPVRNIMGTVVQFAVANVVSKYTGGFSILAGNLLKNFLNRKRNNTN
ncbi:hypothetical protein [Flavobacterium sp.]|uniref:hypothetical protein n=1 Tax=Flavobacterium sp. TaxID=239 RepID=UPI0039189DAF